MSTSFMQLHEDNASFWYFNSLRRQGTRDLCNLSYILYLGGLMMGSDGENVYRRAVEKRPMTIVRDREKYVKTQRRNTMYKRCKEEDK